MATIGAVVVAIRVVEDRKEHLHAPVHAQRARDQEPVVPHAPPVREPAQGLGVHSSVVQMGDGDELSRGEVGNVIRAWRGKAARTVGVQEESV